ncbi:GntR family transcriptional regulator [Gordonia rubripertincta]|uniref:GntR family transcriptional regulator n=1 Tax=Gordonia rubripertincta TaxID=36822 RepID=UPI00117FE61D|nr:GntR family transcriptional regulator [Gordonia rubripertincta]TSD94534.1 GntR family transcriptional regulator [Gordonia rubripertincta]
MRETTGGPVAEDVRRRILAMLAQGTLAPGARLGTERDMAEMFSVSRSTLRSALLPLSRAGVLERRTGRGGGTFIRADVVERQAAESSGLPQLLAESGHASATRVVGVERRPATPIEARALEITDTAEVFAIRRIRLADSAPLSVDLACFPVDLVPDLPAHPLDGSLYELLRASYGLNAAETTETIEVGTASGREATWLEIGIRSPLLVITRVSRDEAGIPFEYSFDLFRADRVRLMSTSTVAREVKGS